MLSIDLQKRPICRDRAAGGRTSAQWILGLAVCALVTASPLQADAPGAEASARRSVTRLTPAQQAALRGAQEALRTYAAARTFGDLMDIVSDRTAGAMARELVMVQAKTIALAAPLPGRAAACDALQTEFNGLVDRYGVESWTWPIELFVTGTTPHPILRPDQLPPGAGRQALAAFTAFSQKMHQARLDITATLPPELKGSDFARQINAYHYTILSPTWVTIDQPDIYHTPLEARFEEGRWRIGAQREMTLDVTFQAAAHYSVP